MDDVGIDGLVANPSLLVHVI